MHDMGTGKRTVHRHSGTNFPDLLIEYSSEKDAPAGRIGLRPAPNKLLPFGEQFEQFLMTWSFLNVMG